MPQTIAPIPIRPWMLNGISERMLVSHYENDYGSAVRTLNEIREELGGLDLATARGYRIRSLKCEEHAAMGSVALHELYFGNLGGDGRMTNSMSAALAEHFGSVDAWRKEFMASARSLRGGSGWVLLSYSRRDRRLYNQIALDHTGVLVDAMPILALDMYEHAYHMDFGANATAYIDAFMRNVDWRVVGMRLAEAMGPAAPSLETDTAPARSVKELSSDFDMAAITRLNLPSISAEELSAEIARRVHAQVLDARPAHYFSRNNEMMKGAIPRGSTSGRRSFPPTSPSSSTAPTASTWVAASRRSSASAASTPSTSAAASPPGTQRAARALSRERSESRRVRHAPSAAPCVRSNPQQRRADMTRGLERRDFIRGVGVAGAVATATALPDRPALAQTNPGTKPMTYEIKPLAFDPKSIKGLSEKLLVSHYENNYGGAVKRLNAITAQLAELDFAKAPVFMINGLKREELIAMNSMVLHEIYFDGIGGGGAPSGALSQALAHDFGSVERWRTEFSAMGKAEGGGSGWVVLAYSPRDTRLVNQWAADHTTNLVGGRPVLVLDMYEHAYHMDYGAKAAVYVDAYMEMIRWENAAKLYERYSRET